MKFIIHVFAILFTTTILAQKGSISGYITLGQEPLVNAVFQVAGTSIHGISDIEGNYEITEVPYGQHTLIITSVEIEKLELSIDIEQPNSIRHIQAIAKANLISELIVTGKSEATALETTGFAVDAIETREIALQSVQANDLLDRSAGVRIRQNGGLGSRIQYNINGLSGNAIRIYIDHLPIETYGPSFSLSSLPNSMIERIEVYKGVVPASLGNDALGGAINVILKKEASNAAFVSYSIGSFNTHQINAGGNYRDKNSGLTVKASAFYNYTDNNYDVWGNEIYVTNEFGKINYVRAKRFHDSYQSMGSKVDLGITNVAWADQLMFTGIYSTLDRDIQHGATMETVYGRRTASQKTRMLNAQFSKRNFLIQHLDISLSTSFSKLDRQVVDTVPYIFNWHGELSDLNKDGEWDEWSSGAETGNPTLNRSLEHKLVNRVNLAYQINGKNKISFSYLGTDFKRKPDDPLRPAAERALIDTRYLKKSTLGLTLENHSLVEKLHTTAFFKYYHQTVRLKDATRAFGGDLSEFTLDRTNNEFGYGTAVSYDLNKKVTLLASLENAIRLPENNEIFGNSAENIDPAFQLRPERSLNSNIGINFTPLSRTSPFHLRVRTNLFVRDTRGMIRQVVANQQAETYSFENQDRVSSKGLDCEIALKYQERYHWTIGTSIFNARFNRQFDDHGSEYIYYRDRLRNEPYFTLNNNIGVNKSDLFQKSSTSKFYYNLGYVHQFFRDWESLGNAGKDIIPSQLVHDIGIAYTFPKDQITISMDVKNILDEQVYDNWALQKPGRSYYLKINYKII